MIRPHFTNEVFSVINLPSKKNALISELERCPFSSFQNDFSSESAALQSFLILSI